MMADYFDELPRCPTDGTILDDQPTLERGRRECPRCRATWSPGVIYA